MTRETKAGLLSSEPDPLSKGQRPHPSALILCKKGMKVKKNYSDLTGRWNKISISFLGSAFSYMT